MQVTSWNRRGLGNPIKSKAIKDLMKMASSEILLLQETKIEEEALLLLSKSNWNLNAGKAVSARGSSGGLATLWSEDKFQLNRWFATQHWIFTDLYHYSSKISLALFHLYVPINYSEKRECWKSLSEYIESISPSNLVLASDLNINLSPHEKKVGFAAKTIFKTRWRL